MIPKPGYILSTRGALVQEKTPFCSLWVETIKGVSPSAARPRGKSPDGSQARV